LVGPVPEDETIYYFRQIISALDYCHSFNICHRDLKPENILLSSTGQIKIADFGMAAIQQNPNHRLKTACGSPHYAAPELVGRRTRGYRGDMVDVWSVGVILYACLCARLPFDDKDMPKLLAKAKRGIYFEPNELSIGSRNLIRKMLNPEPEERITISQIWKHGFIVEYDYLDDLNGKRHDDNLDDIRKYGRSTRLAAKDIDMQTLRQLKSMWHMYTEKELAMKLIGDECVVQ
jgi:serine/threonine-protein kinase HSL1 (negative regulator of Swe1 kinase)